MAKKKLNEKTKLEKIAAVLQNTANDIISSKKTPEVLTIVIRDIALCMAIRESEYDDDLEIARLWINQENVLLQGRGAYNGYRQLSLSEVQEENTDAEPKSKNTAK